MSASFVGASTQYLTNTVPAITAVPITVSCWFNPASSGVQSIWALSKASGVSTHFFRLGINATGNTLAATADASASVSAVCTTAITTGAWHFAIARFISATNRRIDILYPNGATEHVQETTSRTPVGIDTMTIGCRIDGSIAQQPFSGQIAEIWYTNADVQPGGAALNNDVLRTLAYAGPFAYPHIIKDLIDYRSMWKAGASSGDTLEEVSWGQTTARQTWTNINSVTTGAHPPLPYWYKSPVDRQSLLMI